ncbi:Rne/Rng family ribonuclease [Acaryochloris marina]|uniref:Ribonuclease E n=1 Tax=Acaryochloris marina (strain MBIC 11017) TaxID=329726 RepID=B0CB87_ACAM1|nr:Rne/Rng family ribonuclease [Acaryochloris marina]ABW26726.1 ribonuclease E [Acaryochloris marina MBIC11017]BDM81506.1 ribonuclease E [Acaryochloris marina MBIC10699]
MPKQIIIAEQHRIAAVFSEDQIQELIVATGSHQVGDIYLGIVENVLPGIDAAFVNIGDAERNGFIHVSDLGPVRLKRNSGAITELLAPQQKVLVQIMKEPTGTKGPRLTGNISLPGRYLVLMPSGRGVNLSRRIRAEDERSRLRALGILIKPAGMGLLVRTEAEGVAEEAIIEDLELLQRQWESVQQQAASTRAPALLDRDTDFIQRVLRDVYSSNVNRIVVDSTPGLKRVKQHLVNWNNTNKLPQGVLVDQHRESTSILEYFRVNAAIREALKPRVDLPSGGYIIIEKTEALTVVDVNSGSFTRSATARETVLWTNCEAAAEIARQLRLRNIAGVIIIDFIDMDSRRDQLQVLEHFNKALKADKARPQIAQLTELGLVELTRKRQGQNIYELFGTPCPACSGLGHLVHLPGEAAPTVGEVEWSEPSKPSPTSTSGVPLPGISANLNDQIHLDPSDDLQELDLTNHPSYQERGNRRRRRRSRLGDNLSRESLSPRLVRNGSASDSKPVKSTNDTNGSTSSKSGGNERSRGRSSTRQRQDTPPEVISVTMTPEEQDIYAFMGISPTVLFPGEIKKPKSAIVEILAPGETSSTPNTTATKVITKELVVAKDTKADADDIDATKPEEAQAEPVLVATPEPTEEKPAEPARTSTRRRRRRSSASSAKQLSLDPNESSE